MRRTLLLLALLAPCWACGRSEALSGDVPHPKFAPGQVWKYEARPREQTSRAVVLRVDRAPAVGSIIHLALEGVALRRPGRPGGVERRIPHLAFSEAAVDRSVTELERAAPVPEFRDQYEAWRAAFAQQPGRVWTTSLAETLSAMEAALQRPR